MEGRIAYIFSVWNSYRGYYFDYWFPEGPPYLPSSEGMYAIDRPDRRFRNYNTKMYWYKIP